MTDYTEEQRVKQVYPDAACVKQTLGYIVEIQSHIVFCEPIRWFSTEAEAWADASRRIGNEFVDEVGPLAGAEGGEEGVRDMGWSLGYDEHWKRDIGYGVPAVCDYPGCEERIDRGLSYVCGGDPYGGERGCGLYFCSQHLFYPTRKGPQVCEKCSKHLKPFQPKPDLLIWTYFKMTDASWEEWRVSKGLTKEAVDSM